MFEYLMLDDVRAWKYSKTGARTCSILEKFAFDTTLKIKDTLICILRRHPTTKKLFAFLLSRQFAKEAKQQAFNYIPRRQILLDQLFFLLCIFKY